MEEVQFIIHMYFLVNCVKWKKCLLIYIYVPNCKFRKLEDLQFYNTYVPVCKLRNVEEVQFIIDMSLFVNCVKWKKYNL